MSRGRSSKQVDLFQDDVNYTTENSTTEVKTEGDKKPLRINGYCSCCGKEIYSGLIHISLTSLTGNANWSRSCSIDKLVLCSECAKELNGIIDTWIISKNSKLKKPHHIS